MMMMMINMVMLSQAAPNEALDTSHCPSNNIYFSGFNKTPSVLVPISKGIFLMEWGTPPYNGGV